MAYHFVFTGLYCLSEISNGIALIAVATRNGLAGVATSFSSNGNDIEVVNLIR